MKTRMSRTLFLPVLLGFVAMVAVYPVSEFVRDVNAKVGSAAVFRNPGVLIGQVSEVVATSSPADYLRQAVVATTRRTDVSVSPPYS